MTSMGQARYRHVIWDWNGTLFDDAWLCVEGINTLLEKRGMPLVTLDGYQRVFDFPVIGYYQRIGFDFSSESWDDVAAEYIDEYNRRRFECRLQDNAIDVLNTCADRGLTQSLLSAYKQGTLEEIVDFFGARGFFTQIVGLDDIYAASKIDNGHRLMDELDLHSSEVVLIGDTTHDFEVARAIGADCVLVPSGHQARERLDSCGVRVLDSITDVLTLFA